MAPTKSKISAGTAPQNGEHRHPLTSQIGDRSARGIYDRMVQLIRSGYLLGGASLPTVREFAGDLGVSTGSVAEAWARLREDRLIVTRRRGGTIVAFGETRRTSPSSAGSKQWYSVDLAQGLADPGLQPQLGKALMASLRNERLHAPENEPISESLAAAAVPTFPFLPEACCASGGGTEGTILALEAVVARGDLVAIEEPTSPRILDALRALGVRPVGVRCDREGPTIDGLAAALRSNPTAFIYQPRAQVPLGHRVTEQRARDLSEVLSKNERSITVIEDDNIGPIAQQGVASIGTHLPDQVLHIRAYCKTYGVDLRTSIIAGPSRLVDRARQVRSHGVAMTSRILQDAIAFLINDPDAIFELDLARRRYAQRRERLQNALSSRGLSAEGGDGFVLWLPVDDEVGALLNLASFGVSVGAGNKCFVTPSPVGHLRIATSRLPDDADSIEHLADIIQRATHGGARTEY